MGKTLLFAAILGIVAYLLLNATCPNGHRSWAQGAYGMNPHFVCE